MVSDTEIGRNVTRIRGSMSQKDLADEMRSRGFRWSQATVWAVEKGERPLRLAEADALGAVLGIHHTVLLSAKKGLDLVYEFRQFSGLLDEIEELAYRSFERQRLLAMEIDWHADEWDDDLDWIDSIARNAVDAAIEGLVRAEANYRGMREVSAFPESADASQTPGKYSDSFMNGVMSRLADERARIGAARTKESPDGLDQAT